MKLLILAILCAIILCYCDYKELQVKTETWQLKSIEVDKRKPYKCFKIIWNDPYKTEHIEYIPDTTGTGLYIGLQVTNRIRF